MNEQQQAAIEAMRQWLADEHELGKAPTKLEIAGEFDLHELHYYILRYKKSLMSRQWLLGVAGGYEAESLEHCGHVYSEMEEYDPATAQEKAVAMVEMIRQYWMEQAKAYESSNEEQRETGPFAAFVLLQEAKWDSEQLKADLLADWGIPCLPGEDEDEIVDEGDNLIFDIDGMMAVVSLVPAPVPDGEAEQNAATNYMWPEAEAVTKTHQAHLIVALIGDKQSLVEKGKIFTKLCAVCSKQTGALGVYTAGTVFQPEFYQEVAGWMQEDPEALPLLDWVYIGLYRSDNGGCAYTYGLETFGKDEIEVLDTQAEPNDLRNFVLDIVDYILREGATLRDGETIGFSAEQKLSITRSPGEALDGMTIKIDYPED